MIAMILCMNHPASPIELFEDHFADFSDDCRYRLINVHSIPEPTEQQIKDLCLVLLQDLLHRMSSSLSHHGLPEPVDAAAFTNTEPRVIQEETSYDSTQLQATVDQVVTV
jgi:hypothetical protein